jgi:hypothetical protein
MKRNQKRDERREQEWHRHMAAVRKSGLTASAYCRKHRLTEAMFYYWQRKLRRAARATRRPDGVKFRSIPIQAPLAGESTFCIKFGNGARIEFSREPSVEWMKAILHLLR